MRANGASTAKTPQPGPRGERRARARVPERFPVRLRGADGTTFSAEVLDYDEAGARVAADAPLAEGSAVRASFVVPVSLSRAARGLGCELGARVRGVRAPGEGTSPHELILAWDAPLGAQVAEAAAAHKRRMTALVFLLLATMVWFRWVSLEYFWYNPLIYSYGVMIGVFFVSRFILAAFHRTPLASGYTPSLSVVISVRNEEALIAKTVQRCFAADYPPDKREVIVVDDGSSDGTAAALRECQRRFPELQVITLPPSGKRHGMAAGFRRAKGELVVVIDSDTFIHPSALRHIVTGFEDPTLGAMSGHTEVENVERNMLTKLQEVRYFLSYRILKAPEGLFGCVTCCPGCLSAYRRSYVLEALEPWLKQRFLGAQATFGDDRSLTNFIMRKYRVGYNENALSTTMVPETWGGYLRQQVRWKKSWLRETLIAASFMHRKHPVAALSFYVGALVSLLSPLVVARVVAIELLYQDMTMFHYLVGMVLVGLVQCVFYLSQRPDANWLLGMVVVASQIVLGPQTYYAVATMRRNHWGTR